METSTARLSLLGLPDEILQQIISFVPWRALVASQRTCKRLNVIGEYPSLWRRHCLEEYDHWHPRHNLREHILAPPAKVEHWKQLLVERKQQDSHISTTFETLLTTPLYRLRHLLQISDFGYDAKEQLLHFAAAPADGQDVLARRYWALDGVGCIERSVALAEWGKLARGEHVPLERALGVYDLFAAERPPYNLDQISAHLDLVASDFKVANPTWSEFSARQRAIALTDFLREKNYMGISPKPYESLQNNLISIALCEAEHPSLPLISVAIYCCVAQRLDLDAHPCGFPGHVLAIINAPADTTLDGKPCDAQSTSNDIDTNRIYLDPFTTTQEVPISRLRSQLSGYGITTTNEQDRYLGPASTLEIVQRTLRNISDNDGHPVRAAEGSNPTVLASVSPDAYRVLGISPNDAEISQPRNLELHTTLSFQAANYAAYWAAVLFAGSPDARVGPAHIGGPLSELVGLALQHFKTDVPLFTKHIMPLLTRGPAAPARAGGPQADNNHLAEQLGLVISEAEDEDATLPVPKPRVGVPATQKVRYRVGDVFRHHRYNYLAVITGWDTECAQGEVWIRQMGVDRLGGGRGQCFYHAVVEDGSERYVAEENVGLTSGRRVEGRIIGGWAARRTSSSAGNSGNAVGGGRRRESEGEPKSMWEGEAEGRWEGELVGRAMPPGLAKLAGRWFKRWDKSRGCFVSNVKEAYPDD